MRGILLGCMAAGAALLLTGCEQSAEEKAKAAEAKAAEDARHFQAAEALIRGKLKKGADVRFRDMKSYTNEGINVVCGVGDAAFPGQPVNSQRFIVLGGKEAFLEIDMEAGEMDKSVREYCRDKAETSTPADRDIRDDAAGPSATSSSDADSDRITDATSDAVDFATDQ